MFNFFEKEKLNLRNFFGSKLNLKNRKSKNNISSAKIKTLEEENKSLRDELQFFKNYAQRWNVNGENVTKIISKAYLNNNNND